MSVLVFPGLEGLRAFFQLALGANRATTGGTTAAGRAATTRRVPSASGRATAAMVAIVTSIAVVVVAIPVLVVAVPILILFVVVAPAKERPRMTIVLAGKGRC